VKESFYAGGSVIVSDEMATAILHYASALAWGGKAEVVEIPAVSRDGAVGSAQILLGPSSQIWATPTSTNGLELDDERDIRALDSKTNLLQPARPQASEKDGTSEFE
jgi:hypothetical protein